jgi:hypothetical protein
MNMVMVYKTRFIFQEFVPGHDFFFFFLYCFPKCQILNLCQEKQEIAGKVHAMIAIIDKFAERGLRCRSLRVAYQV